MDALRGYVTLAGGLTEMTRAKAVASAKALLSDENLAALLAGGQKAQVQVQTLADEIVAAGRANHELIRGLIQSEVERVVGASGAATGDDLDTLQGSIDRLERRVAILESEQAASTAAARTAARKAPAKKTAAKKTAKKTVAKKATAKKAATKSAPKAR